MKYDYLIVGAGLFGSVFAREMTDSGKKCLVIDRRNHIAGNIFTESIENINVHKYGAHIFHTSNKNVWEYVNRFTEFNRFTNCPVANYKGEIYNMPFNMNTFSKMWGIVTPSEAWEIIDSQIKKSGIIIPKNLEEKAISMVGEDIYIKLVKGYTEKQWGCSAKDLPMFIINRLPLRFTYDNNYFNDKYQGIPEDGYTKMVENILSGIEVRLNADFLADREYFLSLADKVIYTGQMDKYFGCCLGALEYRSLDFVTKVMDTENYQGVAVMNFTEFEVPYTRVIEHKHFASSSSSDKSVVTWEYPKTFFEGNEPYYAVNNEKNENLLLKYKQIAANEKKVVFAGRLGEYKYYDMDDTVEKALGLCAQMSK